MIKILSSKFYVSGFNGLDKKTNIRYTWGNEIIKNSFGFREKEIKVPKPKNTYRIMFVVDSFTWGAGLPIEKRYAQLIEDSLNNNNKYKYNFETIVFSFGGGMIDHYVNLIKKYTEIIEADLVVIGMMYNDTNKKGWKDEGSRDKYISIYRKIKFIFNKIIFVKGDTFKIFLDEKSIMNLFENLNLVADPFEANYISGYKDNSVNWINFNNQLNEIYKFVLKKTNTKPYIILLTPALSSIDMSRFEDTNNTYLIVKKMFNKIESSAKEIGFKTIDTLPEFKKNLNNQYLALNIHDAHPNEIANKAYADIFLERFKKDFD
tara:strand:+ start:2848 stop:3804 length:957 start_codon:yes stop_codon:yes gene_type:complete